MKSVAAVAERRFARRQLEEYPNEVNTKNYKMKTAKAKNICELAKRNFFQQYVETIQYGTPSGDIWRKIDALKTGRSTACMSMEINGTPVNDSID